jgi:hypothetical protein
LQVESQGAGAFFNRDWNLFHNFQTESLEGGNVHGRVGKKPDPLNSEIGKNLAPKANGAQDAA